MTAITGNADFSEINALLSKRKGLDQEHTKEVLDAFFGILKDLVCTLGYVELHGFGSFSLKTRDAKEGTTPQGVHYSVGKRHYIEFNPFQPFREQVEILTGTPCIY